MSFNVTFNGTTYPLPSIGQRVYGAQITNFLSSVAANALSKAGGSFVLTADVTFGTNYGVVAKYLKSVSANIAQTGVVRLGNDESIVWRNAANTTDIGLKVNASNVLEVNGVAVVTISGAQTLTNKTLGSTNTISGATATGFTNGGTVSLPSGTDTLVGRATTDTLTNKTIVAASNTITTAASGNLAATELNAALAELQTDVDTRATSAALTTHASTSTGVHGLTGAVVGTTDVQSLTNKTLGSSSTITGVNCDYVYVNSGAGYWVFQPITGPEAVVGRATNDTLTNKTISGASNAITNVSLTSGVTGTLAVAKGGTGQTTASAAINALVPTQTGNASKVLTTNGTSVSWVTAGSSVGIVVPGTSDGLVSSSGVPGRTGGSLVGAGYVGEYLESANTTATGTNTSTFVNLATLSLTAGEWDVTGIGVFNGASVSPGIALALAVSLFSANTSTDHVLGSNLVHAQPALSGWRGTAVVPAFRVSVNATTTVYLKGLGLFGGPAMAGVRLSARRVA